MIFFTFMCYEKYIGTVKYVILYKQHVLSSFSIHVLHTRKCIIELIIIPKKYIMMCIN